MKKQIAIIFGGRSSEHAVSLQSAQAVLSNLPSERWQPIAVGISPEGEWFLYTGAYGRIADGSWRADAGHCRRCVFSCDRARPGLILLDDPSSVIRPDAVFPVLHGKNGEDGTVQGMIELSGLPLVGCGTLSSALCMDKHRAHLLAQAAGVAVPKGVIVRSAAEAMAREDVPMPAFVKPVRSGSSFGVSRIASRGELAAAVERALQEDGEVIVEEAVEGFEVGCAVLGNDALTTGAVDEIELAGDVFDYEEKYTLRTARIHCPARIPEEKAREVRFAATTVYRVLGCRGFARVDLFLTPDGRLVFNEVNTIPGMTAHSRYPGMMRAAGLEFSRLLDRLVELAFEKEGR